MGAAMDVTLGPLQSIPEGEGRVFVVAGTRLAVFRLRHGGVFATQAECPHRGGPLADGLLGGRTLICPLHSLKFDLVTGQSTDGACTLKTYPARIGPNGQIVVKLEA
ncbi:MAG TPA: Rieske 2Fe-2S domain-containing protein [Polyangiaceae bacterium]|nr:Rieske 2Fe-2S domain-containing protein [Polyangiaceae bacterium]